MRLTVLGSGTIYPNTTRSCASYLIEDGRYKVLMDLGPGSLLGLGRAGVDTSELHGILVTHRHADHCCELQWLMQLERTKDRTKPLRIAAPGIFKEYLEFFDSWGRNRRRPNTYVVELNTMPGKVDWGNMAIEGLSVPHVEYSIGFRIRCGGYTLAYTGDTGPGDEVVHMAEGADMLISECSLAPGTTSEVHLNPEQVAEIASTAKVKKVLLSHFPPGADIQTALDICRDSGLDTILAQDGMCIELEPTSEST